MYEKCLAYSSNPINAPPGCIPEPSGNTYPPLAIDLYLGVKKKKITRNY